ncbi:HmuY family protein [Thalassolituus sp. C2-1]|uniref:HmuY family protein n=1 Tax=Venatorbacter sp. C2-1 TaxID=2597518 RepID=UPI0011921663|nr:HmuY family protein [Thalassolituus sp. C2-1]TVV45963.1 hypothetical protein FOT50_03795 [Thalassolituus sp. C2-1]
MKPSGLISFKRLMLPLATGSALLLSGCGGDDGDSSNGNTDSNSFSSLKINAASYTDWQYVNLSSGELVTLTAEQAATSTDWHIALRRTEVKINGGVSGSGNGKGALAATPDGFYDAEGNAVASVFTNADADIQAQALSAEYNLADLTFKADSYVPAIQDWYIYNPANHQISANSANGWLLRHADGTTYSKFVLDAVSYSEITVRYETQATDTTQFAGGEKTLTAAVADGATELCLDFDAQAAADCSGSDWDLRYEINLAARAINLWSNGGVYGDGNGAAFGAIVAAELAAYTSATMVDSTSIAAHYSADSASSIFSESSWYAYNLSGAHKLWPNFRTYIVDADSNTENSEKFAVQISNYYSLGGSGSPEIRFKKITQ